jgi:hypothetical protein
MQAIIDRLILAVREREQLEEHQKLITLIESDRHLLIDTKALSRYLKPRFTEDTDYLVGHNMFLKVRKWFQENKIQHQDLGEAIQSKAVGIDVIDSGTNPVLKEILKHETGVPSPEALAATKYISIVSETRDRQKMHFDIGDFMGLVCLDGFDMKRFLGFLVDRYEEQRGHAEEIIDKIKKGEFPIEI